jgi:hypothetical protein
MILPGAGAGQTTKRRKNKIWQKQNRLKRSWQKKGKKKAKEEKTPLRRRRKKWVAVINEDDLLFARIVGLFVISSKKRGPIDGTHAAIAAEITFSNPTYDQTASIKVGAAWFRFSKAE